MASKQLILWIAVVCLIGAIATEEDEGTTRLLEAPTTTSPPTVSEPFTSTTTTTTVPSPTTTTIRTPTVPILARANPIAGSSSLRSIITTPTTTETTTKPSTKRQISLSEFQQLVAKVNDEISMLRNQSANLSQTYEELVRRYNERTSQIPIVLYDVTECSNSTTVRAEPATDTTAQSTTTERATTTSERPTTTTLKTTTTTTSTTALPSTTRRVEYSPPKFADAELLPVRPSALEVAPPNTGNSHTQIYGNKYYNYIHYFMYPPDESQLEEIEPPAPISQRRRAGNDSKRTRPPRRRRPFLPLQTKKNRWEESIDSREAVEESEIATQEAFRRRPFEDTKPTGELRDNLRHGSTEPRAPFRRPAEPVEPYPYDGTYRAPPRNPIEPPGFVPSQKLPQYPYVQERIPPRIVPQEQFYALVPELEAPKQTPAPESTTKASPYSDRLTAFLNRRNINRNDPYTVVRVKATTPSTTITTIREPVTPPSIESLFTFGANPVSYAIPTTSKPSPGLVRNGWDGYDFSFIRKALESKKRLQRERRSWGVKLRDL